MENILSELKNFGFQFNKIEGQRVCTTCSLYASVYIFRIGFGLYFCQNCLPVFKSKFLI